MKKSKVEVKKSNSVSQKLNFKVTKIFNFFCQFYFLTTKRVKVPKSTKNKLSTVFFGWKTTTVVIQILKKSILLNALTAKMSS